MNHYWLTAKPSLVDCTAGHCRLIDQPVSIEATIIGWVINHLILPNNWLINQAILTEQPISALWFIHRPVISEDFSWFQDFFTNLPSWKKRSSHQGKKEVAGIVSKPLVSCLCGCGESVNPPKLNIQEVQVALSSRPKGDPGPLPIFQDSFRFFFFKSHPCNVAGLILRTWRGKAIFSWQRAPLWGICKFLLGLLKGHQGKDQGQQRQLPPLPPLSIRPDVD